MKTLSLKKLSGPLVMTLGLFCCFIPIQESSGQLIRPIRPNPIRPVQPVTPVRPIRPINPDIFRMGSSDDQSQPDTASAQTTTPHRLMYFANDNMGRLLEGHLHRMVKFDRDAERNYQASLVQLRKDAVKVVPLLAAAFEKMPEKEFARRWTVMETLREMEHPSALKTLKAVALSPVPQERWTDDQERSSQDQEVFIRATAIDGLAVLSKKGQGEALEALKGLIRNPDITLRRRAIRGILATGDYREQEKYLKSVLPSSDHHLVTLAITNIKSIPHPDMPEQFPMPNGRNRTEPPKVRR